ncbi:MAG TPA: ABC transporter ATP-binding protein [Actinomycetes bacterium]
MRRNGPAAGDDTLRRGLRILGTAVRHEPRVFAVAVGGSAVYGVMTVASAWVLGRVTDRVIVPAFDEGRTSAGALAAAAAAIVAVAVLKAAGIVARRLGAGVMQYRLQATYRRRVTRQYLRLPLSWHQRHPTGQLLSNANADVEATWFPIAPLPMAVGVLVMLVVAGVALLLTDLVLAVIGFLVFPAIFGLNVVYQRRLSPLATRAQQLRAEVSGVAHESFDGALVVKTLGREAEETERFRAATLALRDAQVAVGRVRGLFDPALEALPTLGVLAVLLVGTARIESGDMAAGDLVQVAYLFTILAFPVRAIGWVLGELPRSVVGWDRVSKVLEASGGLAFGTATLAGGGGAAALAVRSVRFGYDDEQDVLHDVSFDVEAGRTVAVVGPTGSGKSTLTTLIVRLVDPHDGQVVLDEVDLRAVARGGVAGAAAVVPQQTFLFDDTVRGNVTLGLDVADDVVWDALRVAQADRFVAALPRGLDTRIGERGMSLSGGQRQRLALARAVVRGPRLLVLDDATSSVDPRVEAAILAGLRARADDGQAATVVVVAYRKATIALADEVVYVEHGRVVDRGSHDELLTRCEGYRRLVTAYEREEAERRAVAADEDPVA